MSDTEGTCQLRINRGTPTTPSLWESARPHEIGLAVQRRHADARLACFQCPLLDACERALSALEREKKPVDGVMAGRFADIKVNGSAGPVQKDCRACRRRMRPQKFRDQALRPGDRQHEGEGLCHICHPRMARAKKTRDAAA